FRVTSAARSTRFLDVPLAMEASVPIEQGQITIPRVGADPDAGVAPRFSVWKTRTRLQSPVASFSPSNPSIPHSSASSRNPYAETIRSTGVPDALRARSRRTAYGAPEAPVIPTTTGRSALVITSGIRVQR